uniref:Choline monooxygenase, chloroplastic n=1 Tax=Haptolina brevifila TaxID=156173 RepID=A0A7S2CHD6_9EUKA|mmetsp:Transcript_2470/g.5090  ORF Transcript_2470/g.5090 Transcript_2470/m.5090 type:complete len:693 (+) Transcript_2470:737-2815(+)
MPACFDKAEWPLREMRLTNFRGFLFLTDSDDAPPLEESLGNAPELALADWPLEDLVTVGHKSYKVECNWKFIMQNTSETYHTDFVHRDSLGPMHSEPIGKYTGVEPIGNWDAVHVPSDRSIVPLPGEAAPFPEIDGLRASTYFISLFPTLQLNVTKDCAWWMKVMPDGPTTTTVTQGFLFPKATVARPDFQQLLEPYLNRWHLAVVEDNDISVNQQCASASPHHRPGPYHNLEFAVHRFDNMVLDRVLKGVAKERVQEQQRQEQIQDQHVQRRAQEQRRLEERLEERQPLSEEMIPPVAPGTSLGAKQHFPSPAMLQGSAKRLARHDPSLTHTRALSGVGGAATPFALTPGSSVCVTGASGFIALHLVEDLLRSGYRVTAAVRTDDAAKLAPLSALGSLGDLEIVSGCDLLSPGSFDGAVANSSVCFHTASPFWMDSRITDPWVQLVHPAELGTRNVLDACANKSSKVQRVVLTSSFAALMNVGGRSPWPMDFEYSEENWNVSSAPDADGAFPDPVNAHAYRWGKTVAEKAAWAHPAVSGGQFDLVTILPPMVLGENKQILTSVADLNQSSLTLYNLLAGKLEHIMPGSVGFTDVADVARAHVLAAEISAASGQRYLCSGQTKTWIEIVAILKGLYPTAPLPSTCPDGSTSQPCLLLKNQKIKAELGIEFTPLELTLKAQCDALTRSGLLQL